MCVCARVKWWHGRSVLSPCPLVRKRLAVVKESVRGGKLEERLLESRHHELHAVPRREFSTATQGATFSRSRSLHHHTRSFRGASTTTGGVRTTTRVSRSVVYMVRQTRGGLVVAVRGGGGRGGHCEDGERA